MMTEILLAALALWGTLATILLLITRSQARDQQANFAQLSRVAPEMTREHLEGAIVLFAVGLDDRDRTNEVCAALTGALEKTRSRAAHEALRGERP